MILEKVYDELMAQIEDLKKAIAGGSGGGYRETVLYTGSALANTMALSENIKSFDMVSFIGEYTVQGKLFHQIVTVPKSVIAAVSSDGSEIQITNDAYYISITIDSDGMGLKKGTYQSTIYISKVIGIKF